MLLELGLVDLGNLGGGNRLLLLLSEDLLGLLNKNSLLLSLRLLNGLSLDLNLSDELGSFLLEVGALLSVLLLLSWVLGLLSIDARVLRLNLLVFSSDLLLLINLLHLVIFLNNNSLLLFDFSGEGHLGIGGALTVANLAACGGGISLSEVNIGNDGNGASVVSLVLGGSLSLQRDGLDLRFRGGQNVLLNPVIHNWTNVFGGGETLSVIAEALLW